MLSIDSKETNDSEIDSVASVKSSQIFTSDLKGDSIMAKKLGVTIYLSEEVLDTPFIYG